MVVDCGLGSLSKQYVVSGVGQKDEYWLTAAARHWAEQARLEHARQSGQPVDLEPAELLPSETSKRKKQTLWWSSCGRLMGRSTAADASARIRRSHRIVARLSAGFSVAFTAHCHGYTGGRWNLGSAMDSLP